MLYSRKISVWNCNWFVSIKYDLLLTRGLFYYFKIDHLSYNHLSYNHLSYNHLSYNHLSYTERERSFFIQFILSTLNSPTHYLSYTSFVLQRGDNRSFFIFFSLAVSKRQNFWLKFQSKFRTLGVRCYIRLNMMLNIKCWLFVLNKK